MMKNNKTLFIVLLLAVVASLLTFVAKSKTSFLGQNSMMQFFAGEKYAGVMNDETTVGSEITGLYNAGPTSITKDSVMADTMRYPGSAIPPYYNDDMLNVEDRVYQKSSYHSVVVDDVPAYLRGIKEYVLSIGGKVLNSGVSSGGDYRNAYNSGSLYMKVPVDKFDEATARVTEKVKKVYSENIDANDVTGQLVNTTDNLQSLKDQKSLKEAALLDAQTEVEKRRYQIEIERLNKQIASAEKGLDRVEQTVEYSSISVQAADSERYFNPDARLSVKEEFLRAWESLKEILKVLGYFGIWVLVYSIVWLPIVWVVKKIFKMFSN
ncbi:DUF4349 domain-containing protein [Patescibacteria group bacterium]|nr:DUF4349 domain-containing protein [Patescibacteria group bacterium]